MKAVTFCVSDEEKVALEHFARIRGLGTAGSLARFAVARYLAQYPLGARERGIAALRGTPEEVREP